MLIDSHCHLDFPDLRDSLADCLAAMQQNRVAGALCAGVKLEDFPAVLALAKSHDNLWATVGVHPEVTEVMEAEVDHLCQLASDPAVVGIGETGLDYYWHKDQPEWQKQRFRKHIRAALQVDKPLIIHTREAAADTLRILEEEKASAVGGVMHCFTETWAVAEVALELGFYISLSGIVTFKKAAQVHDVAQRVPLDRLLIETDSPFLAPAPFRGKTNQPAYVRYVAEKIADLRQIPVDTVAKATTANFFNLFKSAQPL